MSTVDTDLLPQPQIVGTAVDMVTVALDDSGPDFQTLILEGSQSVVDAKIQAALCGEPFETPGYLSFETTNGETYFQRVDSIETLITRRHVIADFNLEQQ